MKIKNDDIIFKSTSRRSSANHGIIGIAPDLTVFTGYDDGWFDTDLLKTEKIELADYMIRKWQGYKDIL